MICLYVYFSLLLFISSYIFPINLSNFAWLMFNVLNLYKLYTNKHVHTTHTYYIWVGLLCTFDTSYSIAHTYVYVCTYVRTKYFTRCACAKLSARTFHRALVVSSVRRRQWLLTVASDNTHTDTNAQLSLSIYTRIHVCIYQCMCVCVRQLRARTNVSVMECNPRANGL